MYFAFPVYVFSFPLVLLFLDPCLLPLNGITKRLVSHPTCLSNAIKSRLWEKDPLCLGKLCFQNSELGFLTQGLTWCTDRVWLFQWYGLLCLLVIFREVCLERNVMGPTNKLSGVSKSWVEWPVKTGLCQKRWIVFVDFEQLANRSATV